jgi:hypothetical protein
MTVFTPDAPDLDTNDVVPTKELRDSIGDIDDLATLQERYQAEGYLFFRGLVNPSAVLDARDAMIAVLERNGMAEPDGHGGAVWTGGGIAPLPEDSGQFDGIYKHLSEDASFQSAFDRILGEPAVMVPLTIYRAYPPGKKPGSVHQDGFFSPGISGYRSFWVPLVAMDEKMGGLCLSPGMADRGYLHNTAKSPRSPIPAGIIPEDNWARADYVPGDVLVIHHSTPHVGLPNRSDKLRLSIDMRVQSAAHPSTVMGTLVAFDESSAELQLEDGSRKRLSVGPDTFIRIIEITERMTPQEFAEKAEVGRHLMATFEGDHALMLRKSQAG